MNIFTKNMFLGTWFYPTKLAHLTLVQLRIVFCVLNLLLKLKTGGL
jgi:hypothetical protein